MSTRATTACPAKAAPVVRVPIMIGSVEVLDAAKAIQRRDEALRATIAAGSSVQQPQLRGARSRCARRPRQRVDVLLMIGDWI
jgi:hypothetical protein